MNNCAFGQYNALKAFLQSQPALSPASEAQRRNFQILDETVGRQEFIRLALRSRVYVEERVARRAYDALSLPSYNKNAVPEPKVATILKMVRITPEVARRIVPFPLLELRYVDRATSVGEFSDDGHFVGTALTPAPNSMAKIAIVREILGDTTLLNDFVKLFTSGERFPPEFRPQLVTATLRRARAAFCGMPGGELLDPNKATTEAWTDRIATLLNRYQLAVAAALDLLGEVLDHEDFADGPIGTWFQREPNERVSMYF
jgi:hypothetical protein